MPSATDPPAAIWKGARSRKRLAAAAEATALNRAYNERMWADVASGAPFVFGYGPMEIFAAMDLYLILPVQYGSVMAAKQMSDHYQGIINERGYFPSLANYESLALGYCFQPEPDIAPYGGIPAPTAIVAGSAQEVQVYELYAREFGSPIFFMDGPSRQSVVRPRWWEHPGEWRSSHLVDFSLQELKACIRFLETTTGHYLSDARLWEFLARADEMCEYYAKITDLAYRADRSPITATDFYAEVAIFETHLGQEWALEHVKKMFLEVEDMVRNGVAACEEENARLLWAGTPLWFNLGFYNQWEESHGAIFLETMYLPRAQRMIQDEAVDPVKNALMRRFMNFMGSTPQAAVELYLEQIREYRIDAVILPARASTPDAKESSSFIAASLRQAGIPVLSLDYSPLNSSQWNDEEMNACVTEFIESVVAGR